MKDCAVRVRIEFKRVQTFLFEVPRLRAMVGANVLLGELLRYKLPDLYLSIQPKPPEFLSTGSVADAWSPGEDPLSGVLAAYWQGGGRSADFDAQMRKRYPALAATRTNWLVDAPAQAYAHGVLARDGGHFSALFDDVAQAQVFAGKAMTEAAESTPGLRLEIYIDEWAPGDPSARRQWKAMQEQVALSETFVFRLPVFRRCPELPNFPADDATEYWDGERLASTPMSYPAALRYRHGMRYLRHESVPEDKRSNGGLLKSDSPELFHTLDTASLLRRSLPLWKEARRPPDFDAVAGGGYMAVIHIDGNGVGALSKRLRQKADSASTLADWLRAECQVESLYHQARVLMRRSLVSAMAATFSEADVWSRKGEKLRPYQVLMQGGDDLLLVCRADRGLPLIANFARALHDLQVDGGFPAFQDNPLTIGAGVVIAKSSLPFHRLHSLAEDLAGSAKTLFRSLGAEERASVVDWMVTSNAWAEEVDVDRAAHCVVELPEQRRLLLSSKPYRVLSEDSMPSLEALLGAADQLRQAVAEPGDAARSQLKSLEDSLSRGEALGQLAWKQLPTATRAALLQAGIGTQASPWDAKQELDGYGYIPTRVLDAVEIFEIEALGKQSRWGAWPVARGSGPAMTQGKQGVST